MNRASAEQVWEAALGELQLQVSKPNYDTWLRGSIGLSYHDQVFIVGTPHAFAAEWLEKRLFSMVKKTLVAITSQDLDVQFRVNHPSYRDDLDTLPRSNNPNREELQQTSSHPKLNPRFTFMSFVTGSCNQLAYAAAMGIADKPGFNYNPLFIHSGPGLGKTHLLHAIGHAATINGFQVLYTSTEQFTNEFVEALRQKETTTFRKKFRSPDMLLLDDVQFISGKEQTQEGFFHTFNELYNANRQIVVTSDRAPKCMPQLEDRLCSRFQGGLVVDIKPPDLSTSFAILQAKAFQQDIHIPELALQAIARFCHHSIRELEGGLNRVIAQAKLTGASVTPDLVERTLHSPDQSLPQVPTLASILQVVSEHFQVTQADLIGKKRTAKIATARRLTIYLMREETHSPLTEIGKFLGGRDHSTILQACQKLSVEIRTNSQLNQQLCDIKRKLHSDSH